MSSQVIPCPLSGTLAAEQMPDAKRVLQKGIMLKLSVGLWEPTMMMLVEPVPGCLIRKPIPGRNAALPGNGWAAVHVPPHVQLTAMSSIGLMYVNWARPVMTLLFRPVWAQNPAVDP